MPEFAVTVIGRSREVYYIEAKSAAEARVTWSDVEPSVSEIDDTEVEDVEQIGP
jgi:hypothetical protein